MPIIPGDNDHAIKQNLAKGSKEAADAKDQQKVASVNDHKANLGPVMADNLGEPASKEELKKRAEELNKK